MTKVSEVFASQETISAADLGNREHTVVIAGVGVRDFHDGKKLEISFQNAKKKLIANKTNSKRIATLYGDDVNDWIGKEIVLRAELVDFKGEPTMAVRVQPPKSRPAVAAQQPAPQPKPKIADDLNDAIGF